MLIIQDLSVSLLYALYPGLYPNMTKDHVINGNNLKKALEKVQWLWRLHIEITEQPVFSICLVQLALVL